MAKAIIKAVVDTLNEGKELLQNLDKISNSNGGKIKLPKKKSNGELA